MDSRKLARPIVLLLIVEAILFVVSLPGLGIETRKFTDYAAWAAPIFLGLTLLIFLGVVAAIATARRVTNTTARLGTGVAVAAIAITLFDLSAVAGPRAPTGPLVLSAIVIAVSGVILYFSWREMSSSPATAA